MLDTADLNLCRTHWPLHNPVDDGIDPRIGRPASRAENHGTEWVIHVGRLAFRTLPRKADLAAAEVEACLNSYTVAVPPPDWADKGEDDSASASHGATFFNGNLTSHRSSVCLPAGRDTLSPGGKGKGWGEGFVSRLPGNHR